MLDTEPAQAPYVEVFREVTFDYESGLFSATVCREQLDCPWAEVAIPCNHDGKLYCITCYIVGLPNNAIAAAEAISLKACALGLLRMDMPGKDTTDEP